MKKIGVYLKHLYTLGGGEKHTIDLIVELTKLNDYSIDILTHDNISIQEIIERFGFDKGSFTNIRIIIIKSWLNIIVFKSIRHVILISNISRKYDLFVFLANGRYLCPRSRAKKSLYLAQIPTLITQGERLISNIFLLPLYLLGFDLKRKSYDAILPISKFTQYHYQIRYPNIPLYLLYPKASLQLGSFKKNVILNVGRFFSGGHCKNQMELINAYKKIERTIPGWRLVLVGGISDKVEDLIYFNQCLDASIGHNIEIHKNISYIELMKLYESAKIYWHATGLNYNEATHPFLMEHFGITTIEAMSAGAVPIVINKGGQPEIVDDEKNGFLFNDINELLSKTISIISQPERLFVISEYARLRAQSFNGDAFTSGVINISKKFLDSDFSR